MNIDQDIINDDSNNLFKNSLLSAVLGGGASFLFLIIYLISSSPAPFSLPEMFAIIIGISLVSAVMTIGGTLMDRLFLNYGIINNKLRQVLVFLITIIFIGGISFIYSLYNSFNNISPLLLLIGISGFVIAAILIIIENILWKMRKKVLALEIENRYLEEISQKERILEETTKSLIVSQERNRIARDLHDSVSQGLNGIKYIVYSMKKRINNNNLEEMISYLDELEDTTQETLTELRNMIFALKPSSLDERGLKMALKNQAQIFSKRSDIKIEIELDEIKSLSPEQELAIYRIVQESLTNIQKHSEAKIVKISLRKSTEKVKLIIEDNGVGFNLEKADGNGINNMRSRVFQNNGSIEIRSKPGHGSTIEIEFDMMPIKI